MSRLKRSPEELGFQERPLNEDGDETGKRRDGKAAGATPLQIPDLGVHRQLTHTVLPQPKWVKTQF